MVTMQEHPSPEQVRKIYQQRGLHVIDIGAGSPGPYPTGYLTGVDHAVFLDAPGDRQPMAWVAEGVGRSRRESALELCMAALDQPQGFDWIFGRAMMLGPAPGSCPSRRRAPDEFSACSEPASLRRIVRPVEADVVADWWLRGLLAGAGAVAALSVTDDAPALLFRHGGTPVERAAASQAATEICTSPGSSPWWRGQLAVLVPDGESVVPWSPREPETS